jgi:DNA repair exonuclease SbcCD ATPase subunit
MEEILDHHRGYVAKLRMVGKPTGSTLSATLRIPSSEYGATLDELKTLGQVEREEEAADEVTQQRADLEARLTNAQNNLRHLQELLKKQSYPDRNVLELQRQVASANADINRLEADRIASEHRVVFANVLFAMREEITMPQETLAGQFHSAALAGFTEAVTSISALLLLLISRGPAFLLWLVILYLPARLAWRRLRPAEAPADAPADNI